MSFERITEYASHYRHLEKMSINKILTYVNKEDNRVAKAVKKVIPQIEALVHVVTDKMMSGGRLFYIGAGTSGRLAVVDASECPPTYGVPDDLVIAVIAGGKNAITQAVEFAEDDEEQGWKDLLQHSVSSKDVVIGIAASGTTPYVIGALQNCTKNKIISGSISCNPDSPLSKAAQFPVEVIVGPEFVTGSTRMKCGTAQKLVLNMISTAAMIRLGRVKDNKMVNMQLTNKKVVDRGVHIIMDELNIKEYKTAEELLLKYRSVKKAIAGWKKLQ
jgi:N-acetylmuramic acid 6-phosphate etherase